VDSEDYFYGLLTHPEYPEMLMVSVNTTHIPMNQSFTYQTLNTGHCLSSIALVVWLKIKITPRKHRDCGLQSYYLTDENVEAQEA
jgi:hypothetical protein